MANHCWNWSCFTGDRADLEKLIANVNKAKDLNAENNGLLWYGTYSVALGLPPWQEGDPEYDVYLRYGSKWFDVDIDDNGDHVNLIGSSAWSPVCEFFRKLSAIYNLNVEAEYEEPGNQIGGFFSAEVGEVTNDKELSYNQYRASSDGTESILEGIDEDNYESVEDAVEHFKDLQEVMDAKQWEEFKSELQSVFEDTKTNDNDKI
jgi:hypothetical protein